MCQQWLLPPFGLHRWLCNLSCGFSGFWFRAYLGFRVTCPSHMNFQCASTDMLTVAADPLSAATDTPEIQDKVHEIHIYGLGFGLGLRRG